MPNVIRKANPRRKYARRYRRKRMYRRRAMRSNMVVSRTSALPDRFFTTLKYSSIHTLGFTAFGLPAVHQFRTNSLNDPDLSGVGHQPLSHDQFALLYNRYRVYGMKYSCTFINTSTAEPVEYAVLVRPNPNTPTDWDVIHESPFVKKGTLGVESGAGIKVVSGYVSNPKTLGISKERYRIDDTFQAQMGVSPVFNGPVITFGVQSADGSQPSITIIRVNLTFYAEFFDRKVLARS